MLARTILNTIFIISSHILIWLRFINNFVQELASLITFQNIKVCIHFQQWSDFLLSHHIGKQHFCIWRWENKGHDFFNLIKNASLDKIYDLQCQIHEKVNRY